jgi:excisionase family DNA binding protein
MARRHGPRPRRDSNSRSPGYEVAEPLGFSDQTVYNWIRAKKLPAVKIQKDFRIKQSDADRLIESHATTVPVSGEDSFWDDPEAQDFQAPGRKKR